MNTPWKIALHQLNREKIKLVRPCEYCGTPLVIPARTTNKRFCDQLCNRRARAVRQGKAIYDPPS